jgi:serine protease AprX
MKRVLSAIVFLSLMANSLGAFANDAKISPDLRGTSSTQKKQVIVQYVSGTQTSCSGLLGLVGCVLNDVTKLGGDLLGSLPLVNGVVALLDGNSIQTLSDDPSVAYISPDRSVSLLSTDLAVESNAPTAGTPNSKYTGAGIGVAVIDSGINAHRDLNTTGLLQVSRVVYSQSFVPGDSSTGDQYGHGTHVAGLISGNGASSTGSSYLKTFAGLAPGASIVNLRALDANGSATDSAVIGAIDRAIALKSKYNIRVINLSLGRAVYESYKLDPLCQAVEKAWKNGIVVVVAAGNNGRYEATSGYATVTAPGNDPYVLTVGAMKPMGTTDRGDDLIASYSSKGPSVLDHIVKPDLLAAGNLLISTETKSTTLYSSEPGGLVALGAYMIGGGTTPSTTYFTLSGTSMAAGVVSGAVADLLQAHPALTPDQVKARLMKTASKTFPQTSVAYEPTTGESFTSQYDLFTVGAGYLDLNAALASTDLANGTAMSPTAIFNSSNGGVYLSSDKSAVWGTSATWSGQAVYGAHQFVGSGALWNASSSVMGNASGIWGSNIVWGSSTSAAFDSIWSNNIVWGSSNDCSTNIVWGSGSSCATNIVWGSGTDKGE